MIDTLRMVQRLRATGMPEEQAKALTEELNAGLREGAATKEDLAVAKSDLLTAIAKVKNEMLVWQVGIAFVLYGALHFTH